MQPTPEHARCIACNYPLHSLPTPRCPECGRDFDPGDPATMNLGRVPGFFARQFLQPAGWPIFLLALAGATALFIASGPPRAVPPRVADTLYLLDRREYKDRLATRYDTIYLCAIVLWIALGAMLIFRLTLRLIAQRIYTSRAPRTRAQFFRQKLLLLLILLSAAIILTAWPVRVVRLWVASATPPSGGGFDGARFPTTCPIDLSEADQLTALHIATTSSLRSRRDRIVALALFLQQYRQSSLKTFQEMIASESDAELRAMAIHVVSLLHQPQFADLFVKLLDDPAPQVRSAAADAIDILRGPGLTQPHPLWTVMPPELVASPPINVAALLPEAYLRNQTPLPPVTFDQRTRARLETMMTTGPTTEEREAAARAIVNWPPATFNLRCAEWGVWIADTAGNLAISKAVIEEIPPFVHRIGNPYDSLDERYPEWMGEVSKPIVHITVDQPLALDIEAFIRQGRPWFAYPKPDDIALSRFVNIPYAAPNPTTQPARPPLKKLDDPAIPPMADLREGYPWLLPSHRHHFEDPRFGGTPRATSLGLRWQSLIVLPTQAPWMNPPTIPADPKFKWWTDLRAVPSSFISNRGESERFLYYDGPTHTQTPVTAVLKDGSLQMQPTTVSRDPAPGRDEITPVLQPLTASYKQREAFFIRVRVGQPTAMRFTLPETYLPFTRQLPTPLPITPADAIPAFKQLLTNYGLTSEESDGLIAAWKTQFFQTNGQRLLIRLSAADYDALCPLSIRPPPTTLVRLGFVLTEF